MLFLPSGAALVGRQPRAAQRLARSRRGSILKTRRRGRGAPDTAAVREWARAHGYTVSDRGRVPRHILEAFTAPE